MQKKTITRRQFIGQTAAAAALGLAGASSVHAQNNKKKMKLAMVGIGIRGTTMWGKSVLSEYGDQVEFVGLCDPNPGRLEFGKNYIGATCPTFTDFEKMMKETKPDTLIVTTIDAFHHQYIIKGMQMGSDIITEKPLTIDETKCQAILEAERETGKKCIVTFNYRYSPHRAKIKQLLDAGTIGKVTSADFHWYLDVYHGAAYFRRWHRLREMGGTLLVHKSSHHFDLLNWWLNSEPEEVFAYGDLEYYGKNNSFRHTHCRSCPHKDKCKFFYDITKDKRYMALYVENEKYDGYHRDGCVFREDINIFDKMAVQIKYANNVQVSYSLTTYSPYEGYRIAFNGTKGRIEAWIQERQPWPKNDYDEIRVTDNFGETKLIQVPHAGGGDDTSMWKVVDGVKKKRAGWGHGGGDARMKDKIFLNTNLPDPLRQSAGLRDGAMAILLGIAARNSIDHKKIVRIEDLTDLKPKPKRFI
jgi:predicted dehydrogenase